MCICLAYLCKSSRKFTITISKSEWIIFYFLISIPCTHAQSFVLPTSPVWSLSTSCWDQSSPPLQHAVLSTRWTVAWIHPEIHTCAWTNNIHLQVFIRGYVFLKIHWSRIQRTRTHVGVCLSLPDKASVIERVGIPVVTHSKKKCIILSLSPKRGLNSHKMKTWHLRLTWCQW